jgi:hypothetical protein
MEPQRTYMQKSSTAQTLSARVMLNPSLSPDTIITVLCSMEPIATSIAMDLCGPLLLR